VSPAAAAVIAALVAAGVALLVKGVFFTYSSAAFAYVGLAALCAALCGGLDYAVEGRAARGGAVAAVAAVVIVLVGVTIYFVWLAIHYRD
jgi:hypothetical protein